MDDDEEEEGGRVASQRRRVSRGLGARAGRGSTALSPPIADHRSARVWLRQREPVDALRRHQDAPHVRASGDGEEGRRAGLSTYKLDEFNAWAP